MASQRGSTFGLALRALGGSCLIIGLSACSAAAAGDEGEASGEGMSGESVGEAGTQTETETTGISPDDGVWEVRMPDFSPGTYFPSYYGCYSQTFTVDEAVHLTGFVPRVNDLHVHHYVVQVLDTPTTDDPGIPCLQEPWDNMIWGWAPGGEELHLPEHVGYPAGANGTVTLRFQVHYDNPLGDKFTDSGGFDVLWTKDKREFDAGIATFGDIYNINIPANDPAFEHNADCSPSFSEAFFPDEMHVIGSWLHAHEIGSVLWGEVIPGDGGPAFELGREDPYRFDKQTFRTIDDTILRPGDQIDTHCVFDNSGNDSPVQGGPATDNEMCVNFLMYYPRVEGLNECGQL